MAIISQRCSLQKGRATSRFLPALGFVLLAHLSLSLGCNSSDSEDLKAAKAIPRPEAEFNWIIKRLEHALEAFSPSGSFGIRAKREMTYKLTPPSDSQSNYTAQVTIKSKTFFKSEYQAPAKDSEKKEPKFDSAAYDNILEDDPLADPLGSPNQEFAELTTKKPTVPNTPTPMPSVEEIEIFELAHLEGKWQLITPTDSARAQNWFEYALQSSISTEN